VATALGVARHIVEIKHTLYLEWRHAGVFNHRQRPVGVLLTWQFYYATVAD
jgi:hypothetical protein